MDFNRYKWQRRVFGDDLREMVDLCLWENQGPVRMRPRGKETVLELQPREAFERGDIVGRVCILPAVYIKQLGVVVDVDDRKDVEVRWVINEDGEPHSDTEKLDPKFLVTLRPSSIKDDKIMELLDDSKRELR